MPFISISGLAGTVIPICPSSLECLINASYLSAAWIIALLGIHPTFRQTPPAFSPSTIIVSRPS